MKGCLTAMVITITLLLGSGVYMWINRDSIFMSISEAFEQPEYGKKEYIDKQYGDLLRAMDKAADSSSSIFSFGAAIESMVLPKEVIYIGTIDGKEKTDIIKRFDWNGSNISTLNYYGSGTLSSGAVTKTIMIYKNSGSWSYMDEFAVYIEHENK